MIKNGYTLKQKGQTSGVFFLDRSTCMESKMCSIGFHLTNYPQVSQNLTALPL